MALSDRLATFCTNFDQDLEAGTALATNQYDLGASGRDPGNGQPLYLNVAVDETFTDGGDSATLEIRLVSDDTASIHASTSTLHLSSGTFLKAALTAGVKMSFPIPTQGKAYERYLGVNLVTATAGFDAGELTIWLGFEPVASVKLYPDAQN